MPAPPSPSQETWTWTACSADSEKRLRGQACGDGDGGAPGPQGTLGVFLAHRFEAEAGREAGLRFVPKESTPTHLAGAGSLNQDRVTR